MNRKTKINKSLSDEVICELKVGNLNVELVCSKGNKKIDECMLNILKRKCK